MHFFQADNRETREVFLFAPREQVVVDLAGAHDHALDFSAVCDQGVVDHGLEAAIGEVRESRRCSRMTQQTLGSHEDQRPARIHERLTAQQMEILRGGAAVQDLDVVLGGKLEKALEARARVLGPLALVAVREEQHEAAILVPLGAPRADELIDDDLRAVAEVAELRFPENHRFGSNHAVSVFEPHHGELGQRAVVDLERCRALLEMLHWRVLLPGFRVVQHEVPLAERAALRVLPTDTDGYAIAKERCEGEGLGVTPLDRAIFRQHFGPLLEQALELRMYGKIGGPAVNLAIQVQQRFALDRGVHCCTGYAALGLRPLAALIIEVTAGFNIGLNVYQRLVLLLPHSFYDFRRSDVLADQRIRPDPPDGWMLRDLLVHDGLSVRGLIRFVVSEATVTNEIHDDVGVETSAVREREPDDGEARFRIVGVDVKDRDVEAASHVARVVGAARIARIGRETDLIVGDDV